MMDDNDIIRISVRPGYLIGLNVHVNGGVHYIHDDEHVEQHGDGSETKTFRTRKETDHLEAVEVTGRVASRVQSSLRRLCVHTEFGWYCTDADFPAVQRKIAMLRTEAAQANLFAESVGSRRRVHVGIVPGRIDVTSAEAAREIASTVVNCLTDVRDVLRAGEMGPKLRNALNRARGLDKLATGFQANSILFAFENVSRAKIVLKAEKEKGADLATVGQALDLDALESAIALFTPAADLDGETSRAIDKAMEG